MSRTHGVIEAAIGNHVPKGYVCLDDACRAYWIGEIGNPIFAGDDALDETGFLKCSSCMATLDECAEVLFELSAPIPPTPHLIERARALGLLREKANTAA